MEVASAGFDALVGLALETIVSKAGASGAAALACASTRLRSAASDDRLWRDFCVRDLDIHDCCGPDGTPSPSFQVAYKLWYESFGMYPFPLVKRAKQCLNSIKRWMGANFPEAGRTLRSGASEAELNQAEKALGVKFPIPTRVLYRLCDGQDTVAQNTVDHERLAPLGIIGGYEFYDFAVNIHLLPLSQIVVDTKVLPRQLCRSKHITVAASSYLEKWFCLNCSNGQLYVGTKNLVPDGEIMPCVPEALLRPSLGGSDDVDALLLWLEEHCRRLHSGMIRTREIRKYRSISLYPEAPPCCSVAVTNGVQYPLLFPGKEEFVYESCTPLSAAPGSVEGTFTFVPGRLRKPGGREFEVEVAPIVLNVPDYIF